MSKTNTPNVGEKFKLFCYLKEGSQPVKFEWLKNGDKVMSKNHQYRVDTLEEESILTIQRISASDNSNFSCTVRNKFGQDTQFTSIFVKGLSWIFIFNR